MHSRQLVLILIRVLLYKSVCLYCLFFFFFKKKSSDQSPYCKARPQAKPQRKDEGRAKPKSKGIP